MKIISFIVLYIFFVGNATALSQTTKNTFKLKGQFSSYAHYNASNEYPLWIGGRYIPQINYNRTLKGERTIDFEYSANVYGNSAIQTFSNSEFKGKLKNYRAWFRYSSPQLEIRAGLQKINFGSANILRPLMWFDMLDPRDPLKLTDGVWGILGRYYFLNNANIWLWGLYGNKNPKGWEIAKTTPQTPEFGGRYQTPLLNGEMALSYHHRYASTKNLNESIYSLDKIPENRFGFDARFDMTVGWWIEASWTKKDADIGMFKNQQIINAGIDYTFPAGNGIYAIYEQLFVSYSKKPFAFHQPISFSLASISYPIGMFDNLNTIIYFDWNSKKSYNFINWQKQFNNISLYLIAYWNPKEFKIPTQYTDQNLYGGKGLQLMFVLNH